MSRTHEELEEQLRKLTLRVDALELAQTRKRTISYGENHDLPMELQSAMAGQIYLVYTDGAAQANGSVAQNSSAAAVLIHGSAIAVESRFIPGGSNNVGELEAIGLAAEIVQKFRGEEHQDVPVVIVSDSQYAINVVTGFYRASKNVDLVKSVQSRTAMLSSVEIKWVRGHVGNPANELADTLATNAIHKTEIPFSCVIAQDDVTSKMLLMKASLNATGSLE